MIPVNDKRKDYLRDTDSTPSDADVYQVQEGAPVSVTETPIHDPGFDVEKDGKLVAAQPEPAQRPSTLYVPSLLGGEIKFTVGELFPWRGVFFVVADVRTQPAPHAVIVPVDHTGAHKKLAEKQRKRLGLPGVMK